LKGGVATKQITHPGLFATFILIRRMSSYNNLLIGDLGGCSGCKPGDGQPDIGEDWGNLMRHS
jgi:hypothetical protein